MEIPYSKVLSKVGSSVHGDGEVTDLRVGEAGRSSHGGRGSL